MLNVIIIQKEKEAEYWAKRIPEKREGRIRCHGGVSILC
jgi:hypothetical protein